MSSKEVVSLLVVRSSSLTGSSMFNGFSLVLVAETPLLIGCLTSWTLRGQGLGEGSVETLPRILSEGSPFSFFLRGYKSVYGFKGSLGTSP